MRFGDPNQKPNQLNKSVTGCLEGEAQLPGNADQESSKFQTKPMRQNFGMRPPQHDHKRNQTVIPEDIPGSAASGEVITSQANPNQDDEVITVNINVNRSTSDASSNRNTVSKLKCFSINARSIINKMQELKCYIYELDPDFVMITESWGGIHEP